MSINLNATFHIFKLWCKLSKNQWTHPKANMLPLSIPTLSPFSNSCRRWKQKSDTCSKWNALMSTPLLLGTTEAFKRPTARWFVDDVTKLGILQVDAQETYHLPEHPHIENHWHNYVTSAPSQYPWPSYTPNSPSNQYPQCPSYRSHANRCDTMGYPYLQNATYTNPSRWPPFYFADQADNKYQAKRSNIPGQNNSYSNVIQNHALQDQQCLVSGTLDSKPITILIDIGSSIILLDEQLYYSLSSVPPLQSLPFSVSGADDKPLNLLGKTFISVAIDHDTFQVQLIITMNILFLEVLGIGFLQTHGGIASFPTNQLYLTDSSPKLADPPINTNHIHNTYTPPIHTPNTYHSS